MNASEKLVSLINELYLLEQFRKREARLDKLNAITKVAILKYETDSKKERHEHIFRSIPIEKCLNLEPGDISDNMILMNEHSYADRFKIWKKFNISDNMRLIKENYHVEKKS